MIRNLVSLHEVFLSYQRTQFIRQGKSGVLKVMLNHGQNGERWTRGNAFQVVLGSVSQREVCSPAVFHRRQDPIVKADGPMAFDLRLTLLFILNV